VVATTAAKDAPATHVGCRLAHDVLTQRETGNARPDLCYFPAELVAEYNGHLNRVVEPVVP